MTGVEYKNSKNKYVVDFKVDGTTLSVESFDTEISALCWYNILAMTYYIVEYELNTISDEDWDEFLRTPPSPYKEQTSSRYRGVSVEMRNGKPLYRASLYINGKKKRLGSSIDEEKAAQFVNDAVLKYNLDLDKLNKI